MTTAPKTIMMMFGKTCRKCQLVKPADSFGRLMASRDGLTYACLDCTRIKMNSWRKANPERDREAKRRWEHENKEKLLDKGRLYYANNREKHKAACSRWAKANHSLCAARFAARRATKSKATPSWLTAIQKAQIQEMYDVSVARTVQTGVRHNVDHIFPIKGKGFNGLHVPWNLRVITAHENHQKLNKIPSEYTHLFWGNV